LDGLDGSKPDASGEIRWMLEQFKTVPSSSEQVHVRPERDLQPNSSASVGFSTGTNRERRRWHY